MTPQWCDGDRLALRAPKPADSFTNPSDRDTFIATERRFVMYHTTTCIALIAAGCVFSLAGCDSRDESPAASTSQPAPARGTPTTPADHMDGTRDDVGEDGKTPMDQSQASEHIKQTADIRQAVIADDTLSVGAKNCKIITDESGTVWLRGVVDSQAEKDLIERLAVQIAGSNNVMNELEVRPN